jgi:hypothetical protein
VTRARAEHVPADPTTARVFVDQAERFLEDAEGMAPASVQLLCWQACISAMEAVLLMAGRRVSPGDGAHVLRLREAEKQIEEDHTGLFQRLDDHRELRHDVSYHAGVISEQEAESTRRDATELVAIVRTML